MKKRFTPRLILLACLLLPFALSACKSPQGPVAENVAVRKKIENREEVIEAARRCLLSTRFSKNIIEANEHLKLLNFGPDCIISVNGDEPLAYFKEAPPKDGYVVIFYHNGRAYDSESLALKVELDKELRMIRITMTIIPGGYL